MAKDFISEYEMSALENEPAGNSDIISDEQMAALENAANQSQKQATDSSLGERLKDAGIWSLENVVIPTGEFVDSYTGAPTRAAVGAVQTGQNPIAAFLQQFGEDPHQAPTGKDIAKKAGLGDTSLSDVFPDLYSPTGDEWFKFKKGGMLDPTASGAAGLGIDIAADWTNLIPVSLAAKSLAQGGAKTAEIGAKAAAKGADLITGTETASNAIRGAENTSKALMKSVDSVVNPKVSQGFSDAVRVAKENDIDPSLLSESIEFGPGSTIARWQKHIAEGPAGEAVLARHAEGLKQINDAVDNKISQISGRKVPADVAEAGQSIKQAYDNAVKSFFDKIDLTYDSVQKYYPGGPVAKDAREALASDLNGLEKTAKGFLARGDDFQKSYGSQLMRLSNSVRQANNFKQLNEIRQWIGEHSYASDSKGYIRDLYHDINDALETTVRKNVNPEFADEIINNNKAITDFIRTKEPIVSVISNKGVADEAIFKRLFSDSKKAGSLKSVLSPEDFNSLKGAYLKTLVKYGADGSVSFGSTLNNFQRNLPVMKVVFSPDELKQVGEIIKLGFDYGDQILSKSGTGASNLFKDAYEAVKSGVVNQSVVNKMKERARNQYISDSAKTLANGASESGIISPELLDQLSRFAGKRDSRPAQFLKGSQSVTPSLEYEKRRQRLKALEGY